MNDSKRLRRALGRSVAVAAGYWVLITALTAAVVHAIPGGPAAVRTGSYRPQAAEGSTAGTVSVLDTVVRLLTLDFGQPATLSESIGPGTTQPIVQTATLLVVTGAVGVTLAAVAVAVARRLPAGWPRSLPRYLLGAVAPLTVVSGTYALVRALELQVMLESLGPTQPAQYAVAGIALGLPVAAAILRSLPSLQDPLGQASASVEHTRPSLWAAAAYLFGAVAVTETALTLGGIGSLWVMGVRGGRLSVVVETSLTAVAATLVAMMLRDALFGLREVATGPSDTAAADGGTASDDRGPESDDGVAAPSNDPPASPEPSRGTARRELNAILNARRVSLGVAAFFGLFVLARVGVFVFPPAHEALSDGFPILPLAAELVLTVCFVTLLATVTAGIVAVLANRVTRVTSRDVSTPVRVVLGAVGGLALLSVFWELSVPSLVVTTPTGFEFWLGVAGGLVIASLAYRDVVGTLETGTATVVAAEAHGVGRAATAATYVGFLAFDAQFLRIGPWDREGGELLTLVFSYNVPVEYASTAVLVAVVAVGLPTLALLLVGDGLRAGVEGR